MRILLVKPKARLATVRGLLGFQRLEPLELGYLAAVVPQHHAVRALDRACTGSPTAPSCASCAASGRAWSGSPEELLKVRLNKNSNPYIVFKEKAQGFGNFFDWNLIDNRFDVAIKQNAVAQRMNKMGKYIIFYSGDFDEMKCLSLYRERDEKRTSRH